MRLFLLFVFICCTATGNANVAGWPADASKVDEFGNICCDDEKARLDAFANALLVDRTVKGFIIFYAGRGHTYNFCHSAPFKLPRRGEAGVRAARLKEYIIDSWRQIESNQIVLVDGGFRESWTAEFWLVPNGANIPRATPTVRPEEIRYRRGKVHKRDYHCEV